MSPTKGAISLGGVPIAELDPDELRDAVTVAFQESFLFATSIEGQRLDGASAEFAESFGDALERASADGICGGVASAVQTRWWASEG
ncbi:MAG: hypothetical protein V9F03_01790 [Microthrixaceae bacterium]